jgi:hypothetical protein
VTMMWDGYTCWDREWWRACDHNNQLQELSVMESNKWLLEDIVMELSPNSTSTNYHISAS